MHIIRAYQKKLCATNRDQRSSGNEANIKEYDAQYAVFPLFYKLAILLKSKHFSQCLFNAKNKYPQHGRINRFTRKGPSACTSSEHVKQKQAKS